MEKAISDDKALCNDLKNFGILAILFPYILTFGNGLDVPIYISNFYYTRMSVFLTGALVAFGLFLFSCRGYVINFGGILAILTALIPISNHNNNTILSIIHMSCAGGFFAINGWILLFKFTKSEKEKSDSINRGRYALYIVSGIIFWLMIIVITLELLLNIKVIGEYDKFIGQSIMSLFLGTAWLVKSKSLKTNGYKISCIYRYSFEHIMLSFYFLQYTVNLLFV